MPLIRKSSDSLARQEGLLVPLRGPAWKPANPRPSGLQRHMPLRGVSAYVIYPSSYITKRFRTLVGDPLSVTFSALADPTRRAILSRLVSGEATVTELAEPFDMSMPAVSKHLRVLEQAGLVIRGREAQWRPRRLDPAPLKQANAWLEQYRVVWERRLDRLGRYVKEVQSTGKDDDGSR